MFSHQQSRLLTRLRTHYDNASICSSSRPNPLTIPSPHSLSFSIPATPTSRSIKSPQSTACQPTFMPTISLTRSSCPSLSTGLPLCETTYTSAFEPGPTAGTHPSRKSTNSPSETIPPHTFIGGPPLFRLNSILDSSCRPLLVLYLFLLLQFLLHLPHDASPMPTSTNSPRQSAQDSQPLSTHNQHDYVLPREQLQRHLSQSFLPTLRGQKKQLKMFNWQWRKSTRLPLLENKL